MTYKLNEYFCIYLDILGYSNRIKNTDVEYLEYDLNHFIDIVTEEIKFLEKFGELLQYEIKTFTDNIIITFPVTEESIKTFHLVIKHILDYQKMLIGRNYFIRGGITKGWLYIDKNTIWGPALIESVELEKKTIYPFISISDKILNLFVNNNLVSENHESLSIPVVEIIKDQFFLDYLYTIIYYDNNRLIFDNIFFQKHQNIITNNLNTNKDDRVLSKYLLLAKYHNKFCESSKEKLPEIKNYFIRDYFISEFSEKRKFLKFFFK